MSNPFIPIKTADLEWRNGLPYSILYDDFYFSEKGLEQNRNIFIDGNNLINRWCSLPANYSLNFNIAETGFGTGLNFLLTWRLWEQYAPVTAKLHFISSEIHPLSINDLIKCLNLWPGLSKYAKQLIDNYPVLTPGYHHLTFDNGRVQLTLMLGNTLDCFEQLLICGDSTLESRLRPAFIDAWYLDGFANESIRSTSLMRVIAMLSKEGTSLATHVVDSSAELLLEEIGFIVEEKTVQKGDTISARLKKASPGRLKVRHTPWHVSYPQNHQSKSAIIIGAGLAGCFTAYSLARRGWTVTIIEENSTPGSAGSGNQQAILFPKLSAYKSPLTQFMLSAFLYASQIYKKLLQQFKAGELKGSLLLAYNEREQKAQSSLENWLLHYPELGELVDSKRASDLSGLSLSQSGLYIPLSGWINSPALCQELIKNEKISLLANCAVDSLVFENEHWIVDNLKAPVLILANGHKINGFQQTEYLPVKSMFGQITTIESTKDSAYLNLPLSAEGHVLPELNGAHRVGATYHPGISKPVLQALDDEINLANLNQIVDQGIWSSTVIDRWAGIRAATPDYLPLVGQIPNAEEFISLFSGLESNSKRWIAKAGFCYQSLYACAGFGSRGLTTIPLCAEWLAASINNEMSCLPRSLVQALAPGRFLRRNITRGIVETN